METEGKEIKRKRKKDTKKEIEKERKERKEKISKQESKKVKKQRYTLEITENKLEVKSVCTPYQCGLRLSSLADTSFWLKRILKHNILGISKWVKLNFYRCIDQGLRFG